MPRDDDAQISRVITEYTRAVDRRDAEGQAEHFLADATVEYLINNGASVQIFEAASVGREQIAERVRTLAANAAQRATSWNHHVTSNYLIDVTGDTARLEARYIAYRVVPNLTAEGVSISGGELFPYSIGFYRADLERTGEGWKFARLQMVADLHP
ncbi:nuclear transport factor 2 family protein [Rhodococcoides yunnanense]|uniref:nuclear transport factor 2 family protein n=1 Tax=Rhodococcoides yunnanense TaxID=278209 RepID=UPI00093248B6|nr:nuclear transport factor 2 family protein [Rhodococcus yunnanensis]